uniref:Uncharacterized protein n=1 Tax=Ananas comosus var. bracteatus TaxID=296719 RepID=A0A6V7QQX3_ANACO|nr:unnamed protein product [Ananas comosus var. bracteatus]
MYVLRREIYGQARERITDKARQSGSDSKRLISRRGVGDDNAQVRDRGDVGGIERHQVTVAAVVLALAKNPVVEKHDLSSIRIVLSGVAPLGRELEETPRSRVPQAVFGQVSVCVCVWCVRYLDDPDATSATIDVERWLHTGDIGYVDDDEEVFIVDRVKELIKP